jgi:diguanylate cyclase (GGDEF)-like protein
MGNQYTFSVLMIDIDRFKHINDTYGHLAGDEIMRQLVTIFNVAIRPVDKIGRYGGDEFVVILKNTALNSAIHVAERIRLLVSEYVAKFDGQSISFTISIGVAQSQDCENMDSLLQRADHELYLAKENGRNQVSPICLDS